MPNAEKTHHQFPLRLPLRLVEPIARSADAADRSVNHWVIQAIEERLERERRITWPVEREEDPVGIATYRAEFRWEMPAYDFTDTIVDEAMTLICGILREHGADNPIEVRGPEHVLPLPARLDPIPPYVSISSGDSVTRVDPTRKVREDGSLAT